MLQETDREQWLEARNAGIGASEMPILLGESEWDSRLTLWARKCGLETDAGEDNELMELGRELEGAILTITTRRAGVEITERGKLVAHPTIQWAFCTPDAITQNREPVEVKNLSFGFSDTEWQERIPEGYRIQCHHQMLCLGAKRCLFGVLVWGNRIVWEWIKRDELLIQRIIRAGTEFWGYVERREEPPSDGHQHARSLLAKRATDERQVELSAEDVDDQLTRYNKESSSLKSLRAAARDSEKRQRAAADAIAQQMGSARNGFTADGWQFAWTRSQRKGYTVEPKTIDTFKIKAPKGI